VGFDLCEAILRVASECGGEFTDLHFDSEDGVPVLWWVLGHLQARACRIAEEALVLLKAGYGLGAYSRWRSLHEVVVVGAFLKQHGEQTAARYVDHLGIHRWRLLQSASESGRLADEHKVELENSKVYADELVAKYDHRFLGDYGWAAQDLPASPHRGFRAVEEAADFSHLRVDYRHASASVHATAGMVLEPPESDYGGSTLQTGASPISIATPAHAVALSLVVSTGTMLTSTESWAAPYVLSAMLELCDRAEKALAAGEKAIEQRVQEDYRPQDSPEAADPSHSDRRTS
jgi:hypothetical protein